jgi:hypothetical protein
VAELANELTVVEDLRRRLRAHIAALRQRLEQAMVAGERWSAEEWAGVMFGDPLRGAMARRLIWRLEREPSELIVPVQGGLLDAHGERVLIGPDDIVGLWHPADEPAAREAWRRRLATLGVEQPIEQAERRVTLAEANSSQLSFAVGERVEQRALRGFLRSRGWEVPYMGRWFFIGEATRQVTRHGPIAVLEVDLDWDAADVSDVVVVGALGFRSMLSADIDIRTLPPAIVSEAARDVLGAVARASRPTAR